MDYIYADVVVTDLEVKVFFISMMEEVLPHGKVGRMRLSVLLAFMVRSVLPD
jgi:hypothetical protein